MTLTFLDHFDSIIAEWDRLLSGNEIFVKRLANVSVIPKEMAIDYGLVGPNLRGSGMDWDIRRDIPYGAYPDFKLDIPVGVGVRGTGDLCGSNVTVWYGRSCSTFAAKVATMRSPIISYELA